MNIRPETPRDHAAIADIHVRAFGRTEEAVIVPLLSQRRDYDPELSLVAEINGKIVGHALFSPYTMRLLEADIRAVNLAPIGVDTKLQKQGIGSALIEEGHRIAKSKGYRVSFLLGHDTYYPRFGYKRGVYGVSLSEIPHQDLPRRGWGDEQPLKVRNPLIGDIPALQTLWLGEEGNVDFAIAPGDSFLDWVSPNPNMDETVYLRAGEIVGFCRVLSTEPLSPRMFLAADNQAAIEMAADLISVGKSITLPLHPYSRSASAFDVKSQVTPWNAAMAYSLAPSPFDDYYAQLQEGKRLPGRVIWSVAFDLA